MEFDLTQFLKDTIKSNQEIYMAGLKQGAIVSNCCTAKLEEESDICKQCAEHCKPIKEGEEE